jgi:hypothetical protein
VFTVPSDKKMQHSKTNFILPVLIVLMIASMLVFIKVLPDLPDIVDATEEFREDQEAVIDAPPLPDTDTSTVGITSPDIFEPPPSDDTRSGENVTPGDLEPSSRSKTLAGIVDALIFVAVAVVGGFGIYLLFKYKKKMTLKAMFSSLLTLVTIATCIFFGFMIYRMVEAKADPSFSDYQVFAIMLIFAAPIGIVVSRSMFSRNTTIKARNYALLLTGALMGSFMAALLPLYGVIPLVVAISLFDIYSVRRGPIRKIMTLAEEEEMMKKKRRKQREERTDAIRDERGDVRKESSEPTVTEIKKTEKPSEKPSIPTHTERSMKALNNKKVVELDDDADLMLMYETPSWSIGVGDFVIYSMFAAFVLTHTLQFLPYYGFYTPVLGFVLPWLVFLVTTVGLLGGFVFTLKLLSKKSLMPGLPLAIFLGLIFFLGQLVVMQVINFLAYGKFAPVV